MSVNVYQDGKLNLLAGGSDDVIWSGTKAKFLEEFNKGMIPEGTIVCITDDEEGNEYQQQIDALGNAIGELQQDVSRVVTNSGGLSFYEDEDGNKYVVGADSVPKKLGSGAFTCTLTTVVEGASYGNGKLSYTYDVKNFSKLTFSNISHSHIYQRNIVIDGVSKGSYKNGSVFDISDANTVQIQLNPTTTTGTHTLTMTLAFE